MLVRFFAVASFILQGCIPSTCIASHLEMDAEFRLFSSEIQNPPNLNSRLSDKYLETVPVESELLTKYESDHKLKIDRLSDTTKALPSVQLTSKEKEKERESAAEGPLASFKFADEVFAVSQEYNIDPLLLHAIAEIESQYNPQAVSPVGAQGLMQIMPNTARRFGMKDPEKELFDPRNNLRICSNYLRTLHNIFGNDIPLILAAYNAGEHAVIEYGYKIPPYIETQLYVTKVMRRYLELKNQSYSF